MGPRARLILATDRALAVMIATLLAGTTLAFGGAVWWARPIIALLTFMMVLAWIARVALEGTCKLLKSPLAALGLMALGLAAAQLYPWPAALVDRVSPRSGTVHRLGYLPDRPALEDTETARSPEDRARSPLTVNRSATLRWLGGAGACLALFCIAAQFADRFGRTMVIWGSVVASLFLCSIFGVVQLVGGRAGLYGLLETGKGPAWSPSTSDLVSAPNVTVLRAADAPDRPEGAWAVKRPDAPAAIGGLVGGPGAFLALGSLGLPLAVGVLLQLVAPRGSREGLWRRLRTSGHLGLAGLLLGLSLLSAGLVGLLAGPILCLPFVLGIVVAGLPGARASGLRGVAYATTVSVLAALGTGVVLGQGAGKPKGSSPLTEVSRFGDVREVWGESARIAVDFPLMGAGFGSFATIHPYYKHRDEAPTTALSSLFQWWAEGGLAGMIILTAGLLWCVVRLPGAIRRVGSADRVLAFGLLGAVACFAIFSSLHWTMELAAVALAASAVGGTLNRWLAGGTDLLVEGA